jgi:hypothetical protein
MQAVADANARGMDLAARQRRPSTPHQRLAQLCSHMIARH